MIYTEQFNQVNEKDINVFGDEYILTISEIYEGDFTDGEQTIKGNKIIFNPPLEISCFKEKDKQNFSMRYDFGMYIENEGELEFFHQKLNNWQEKAKTVIEFELSHSFFHTSNDPNYTVFNYAILGCICMHRRAIQIDSNGEKTIVDWIP